MNNKNSKTKKNEFYLLTKNALPPVLLKVLKVKNLIDNENQNIANATKTIGISRTTFYKYCNEVFIYNSAPLTKTVEIDILVHDKIGNLSKISNIISKNSFNIITINQHPPIDGKSRILISISTTNVSSNLSKLIDELNSLSGVINSKITDINNEVNT